MATQELELGTLESDDLRKAWKHEAQNFTPWLAENLDRLSAALGIRLEHEDSEVQIGPYRADIVARDPRDDSRVLIENQLEDANLQHLGQVIAYLAGLKATAVVWIARDFDEAHRSAIRWLNEHTTDPFAFFAVRVRVVRIGNSPLAPIFEVLERPNAWDRSVQDTAKRGELSEIGQFRREFWTHVATRHPGEVRLDYAGSNVYHKAEGTDLRISQYVYTDGVGVFLTTTSLTDPDRLSRIQPYLKPLRKALKEGAFKEDTYFLDDDTCSAAWDIDPQDRANWDRMADWLHNARIIYERILQETKV